MPDIVAVYRAQAQEVADLWNSHCQHLGVEPHRPLQPEGDDGWDIAKMGDSRMLVRVPAYPFWALADDQVGLEIVFRSQDWPRLNHAFDQLLELPLQPLAVMLVDHSWDFVEENLALYGIDSPPSNLLDVIEGNLRDLEVSCVQALHRDLLHPLEEWLAVCRERGYPLIPRGSYYILDVGWDRAGHRDSSRDRSRDRDPITGLLLKDHLWAHLERLLEAPFGTLIVVTLTALHPNPGREYGPWLQALPVAARALTASLGDGDLLSHYHTQRQFALVKPGLRAKNVLSELERLRSLLSPMGDFQMEGEFANASWPEDGHTLEDMWSGSGWDKLNTDEERVVKF